MRISVSQWSAAGLAAAVDRADALRLVVLEYGALKKELEELCGWD